MNALGETSLNSGACDIEEAISAVIIISETEYVLNGKVVSIQDSDSGRALPPENSREVTPRLIETLKNHIYREMYCRPRLSASALVSKKYLTRDHVAALSNANSGSGTWEAGWIIASCIDEDQLIVARDRIQFCVSTNYVRTQSGSPTRGAQCRVRVPKEMRQLAMGFYLVLGNAPMDILGCLECPLVRLYWNLKSTQAVDFIRIVTHGLNPLNIPFRAKVVSSPTAYFRADAALLCIEKHYLTPQFQKNLA
jgi:hypothetical protein